MKDSKKFKENKALNETRTDADYGFIRGANYFGGMKICHLMGASGNGKTWISNAFRVQACRLFYKVKYIIYIDFHSVSVIYGIINCTN